MSQDMVQKDDQKEESQNIFQSMGFAGGTFIGVGVVDVLGHLGPNGLVAGVIGSYFSYHYGPKCYAAMKRQYDNLDPKSKATIQTAMSRFRHTSVEEIEEKPARPKDDVQKFPDESEEQDIPWKNWKCTDEEDVLIPTRDTSMFTLSQLLASGFKPSIHKIFVGRLTDGSDVYVEAPDLCHVALAGNTGGGKSSIMRLIMAQLCKIGLPVLLLNPHFMRYDRRADEDWTPFESYLQQSPVKCAEYDTIKFYLQWMAETLLPKRIERGRNGGEVGKPYFIVIDELPAIVANVKEAPGYLAKILREGRKYGIYLIVAAQDFLAKTVAEDGEGAIRKLYRTAFYVGGDGTTAKTLLDIPANKIPETELGQGTIMLRCKATKSAIMAKVPYVDNESLYTMLGPSTFDKRTSASSSAVLPQSFQPTKREEAEDDREVAQEADGRSGSDEEGISDLSTIRALREIGKRLQKGEDKAKIVKSFGLPYGRATQEMSAVVDMVEEQIRQEKRGEHNSYGY